MTRRRGDLHRLVGWMIIVASLATGWIIMDARRFLDTPLRIGDEGIFFVVTPGMSAHDMARALAARGVTDRPLYLGLLARYEGKARRIRAGEYRLDHGTLPRALLDKLVAGEVWLHSLTVVEGWTFARMRQAIDTHEAVTHTLSGVTDAMLMERLGMPGEAPEGRFFPDTYRFPRGTTDLALLAQAGRAMADRVERIWAARDPGLPLARPVDLVTLASIIEKETGRGEERARIGGVFVRRLQRGMRLQSDPTVIYGLGERFGGNLTHHHLDEATAWNTYQIDGLPPTPIALPGQAALDAAAHPAADKALYFVARGDGTHVFSDTLAEHERAVREYQRGGR